MFNEITFIAKDPIKDYLRKHKGITISQTEIDTVKDEIINEIEDLVKNDVLIVLDGNKNTVIKQIQLCKHFGDTDALNLSIANEYGTSFLTVDNKIVNNVPGNINEIKNIRNFYYTIPKFRDYV